MGYSPWGRKESDMTEDTAQHFSNITTNSLCLRSPCVLSQGRPEGTQLPIITVIFLTSRVVVVGSGQVESLIASSICMDSVLLFSKCCPEHQFFELMKDRPKVLWSYKFKEYFMLSLEIHNTQQDSKGSEKVWSKGTFLTLFTLSFPNTFKKLIKPLPSSLTPASRNPPVQGNQE